MSRLVTSTPRTNPYQSAFPHTVYENETPVDQSYGLTKREFFAALAMASYMIADGFRSGMAGESGNHLRAIADEAVQYADALIERLNEV